MATKTLSLSCVSSAMVNSGSPSSNTHGTAKYQVLVGATDGSSRLALIAFDSWPQNLRRNRIYSATFSFSFERNLTVSQLFKMAPLLQSFDQSTVTWYTMPPRSSSNLVTDGIDAVERGSGQVSYTVKAWKTDATDRQKSLSAKTLIKSYSKGFAISFTATSYAGNYIDLYSQAASAGLRPTLQIIYDDSVIVPSSVMMLNSPTAGYVNPRNAINFSWVFSTASSTYSCYEDAADIQQQSATLYWREGSDGTWHSIQAAQGVMGVTVQANTFPAGSSIQYYVQGTDNAGSTSQTPTYTLSTTAAMVTATPLAPVNSVEDGSAEITLYWSTASDDGFPQNGADLQISTDGSAWTDLQHVAGTVKQYTAPAGTFLGGTAYWRVRAYNIDGAVGEWSETATFVSVAAPSAPVVSVEAVPFATINWQAEGQQAWRVTVDERRYGPFFGQAKKFTLPDYLQDGSHTVQVEVEGSVGLWSQAGELSFTVENAPGDPVTLRGSFDRDAELSWETASQAADFLIYRDGARIGHTSGLTFADRTVLGTHSWQVINRLPSGNYTASNTVQGTLCTEGLAVALLSGGEWLELTKSRNPTRQETYSLSQNVSLTHFAGQEYPEAETSPYKTLQGNFDVSWNRDEPEQAAAFEAMIGKPVIYKAPSGETMVGILAAMQKNPINFFKAYAATIQRIHWRDFVDADN